MQNGKLHAAARKYGCSTIGLSNGRAYPFQSKPLVACRLPSHNRRHEQAGQRAAGVRSQRLSGLPPCRRHPLRSGAEQGALGWSCRQSCRTASPWLWRCQHAGGRPGLREAATARAAVQCRQALCPESAVLSSACSAKCSHGLLSCHAEPKHSEAANHFRDFALGALLTHFAKPTAEPERTALAIGLPFFVIALQVLLNPALAIPYIVITLLLSVAHTGRLGLNNCRR